MDKDKIELFMKKLDITEEEAKELIEYDKAVDQGKKTKYDLTNAQQREINKYLRADRTPTEKEPTKREKEDITKETIIAALAKHLQGLVENVDIKNKTRQIGFTIGEESFDLTLIRHTKGKSK